MRDKRKKATERALDAIRLAKLGGFRCGVCRVPHTFEGGLVLGFRGQVALGLCFDCLRTNEIRLTPTDEGVSIKVERREGIVLYTSDAKEIRDRAGESLAPLLKPREREIEDLSQVKAQGNGED